MSYQQCTRFGTTLEFDRGCLWNGASSRQAENLRLNRVRSFVKIYVPAKYHQAECSGSSLMSCHANREKTL